jgi:transcriptional regulator with XRE-family HTH domain
VVADGQVVDPRAGHRSGEGRQTPTVALNVVLPQDQPDRHTHILNQYQFKNVGANARGRPAVALVESCAMANDRPDVPLGAFTSAGQRELQEMSMRQLGDMAGISNPYLSHIERGVREPSERVLEAIAETLHVSAEVLHVRAGAARRLQAPALRRLRRRATAYAERQGAQALVARAVRAGVNGSVRAALVRRPVRCRTRKATQARQADERN